MIKSNLKKLNIENLNGVANKEFIAILLEDLIVGLEVKGCDHWSENTLKKIEDTLIINKNQ